MKPTNEAIDAAIADFLISRPVAFDEEVCKVAAAMFVEEAFGLVLSDSEISALTIESVESIAEVVRRKMEQ